MKVADTYCNAELCFVQEEHKNMGAWSYVQPRTQTAIGGYHRLIQYIGRETAPSPATGSKATHKRLVPVGQYTLHYLVMWLTQEVRLVAEKDFHAPKHPELEAIPNLQVIKALTSLKSRGYVKEQFAW